MARPVSERLEAVFGHKALPDGIFYSFEFALRFELSGSTGNRTEGFLRSIDRARAVVRAAFPDIEAVSVVLARIAPSPLEREDGKELRALRWTGFRPRLRLLERLPLDPDDEIFRATEGEPLLYRYLCTTGSPATMADIDALIWNSCARDIGIQPKAHIDVFLVDYARGVAVHVYDDRGMDVVATTREAISGLYEQFGPWLLDYDRARMDAVFAD